MSRKPLGREAFASKISILTPHEVHCLRRAACIKDVNSKLAQGICEITIPRGLELDIISFADKAGWQVTTIYPSKSVNSPNVVLVFRVKK